jgi:hypothetical protein
MPCSVPEDDGDDNGQPQTSATQSRKRALINAGKYEVSLPRLPHFYSFILSRLLVLRLGLHSTLISTVGINNKIYFMDKKYDPGNTTGAYELDPSLVKPGLGERMEKYVLTPYIFSITVSFIVHSPDPHPLSVSPACQ